MRNAMIALATLLVGVSLGLPSFAAAWATPGAACTQEGANANSNGFLTCTGGVWISNAVLMGTTSATCDSTKAGYIRYTGGQFEGCNGTGWIQLASSSSLKVYKGDGVTVLGNYLGSIGASAEHTAPCKYMLYANETTGQVKALDYYDCADTNDITTTYYSGDNCTGTVVIGAVSIGYCCTGAAACLTNLCRHTTNYSGNFPARSKRAYTTGVCSAYIANVGGTTNSVPTACGDSACVVK